MISTEHIIMIGALGVISLFIFFSVLLFFSTRGTPEERASIRQVNKVKEKLTQSDLQELINWGNQLVITLFISSMTLFLGFVGVLPHISMKSGVYGIAYSTFMTMIALSLLVGLNISVYKTLQHYYFTRRWEMKLKPSMRNEIIKTFPFYSIFFLKKEEEETIELRRRVIFLAFVLGDFLAVMILVFKMVLS